MIAARPLLISLGAHALGLAASLGWSPGDVAMPLSVRARPAFVGELVTAAPGVRAPRPRIAIAARGRKGARAVAPSVGSQGAAQAAVARREQAGTAAIEIRPRYPRRSRLLGEEGEVWVRVLLSREGRVAEARLSRSSGFTRLDEAALEAARAAEIRMPAGADQQGSREFKVVFKLSDPSI